MYTAVHAEGVRVRQWRGDRAARAPRAALRGPRELGFRRGLGREFLSPTCRISSASPVDVARVRWAVDGGGANGTVTLVDDGTGPDSIAGDGKYAAQIPGRSDGTVVRFAIEVTDDDGESLRVPLEPAVEPYGSYPGTFYLYEVDDDEGSSSGSPVYRIIMTSPDHQRLGSRSRQSNVLLPATFIARGRAYHLVGVRYRGENSRNLDNRSYKIRLPAGKPRKGCKWLLFMQA